MLEWIRSRASRGAALCVLALLLGLCALPPGAAAPAPAAPDVIVADLHDSLSFGSVPVGGVSHSAFAVGTTSCNMGNAPLDWKRDPDPNHPVIAQNLYRVKDGRIEQLGLSWLKHGFYAVNGPLCGACATPGGNKLGVNCSDPYSASLNSAQVALGPRSQVNPSTGIITIPYRRLKNPNLLDGRLHARDADVDPAQNKAARYFTEAQYIHPQDAQAGKGNNNASYREVTFPQQGGKFTLTFSSPTVRELPAIYAWRAVDHNVRLFNVDVPGDGRFILGIRSTRLAKGGYHHEIALHNLNSDRAAQALTIRTLGGKVGKAGFHGVKYDQENYDSADWKSTPAAASITWATDTFKTNKNANALRWGTLYNFWFDSERPVTQAVIQLFKPGKAGEPAEATVQLVAAARLAASADRRTWVDSDQLKDRQVGAKGTFRVTARTGVDRELDEVTSSDPGVEVTVTKGKKKDKDGRVYWVVKVQPTEKHEGGYFETILTFKTKTAKDRPARIRAFGELPKK